MTKLTKRHEMYLKSAIAYGYVTLWDKSSDDRHLLYDLEMWGYLTRDSRHLVDRYKATAKGKDYFQALKAVADWNAKVGKGGQS